MSSLPTEPVPTKPLGAGDRCLEFHLLGRLDWERVWSLQQRLMYETGGRTQPQVTVLCCEHPDSITIGRSGSRGHIRMSDEELHRQQVSIKFVGRGGGCVYHTPGQLCLYPILSLERFGWSVGEYLRRLQHGLCRTLREFNIEPVLQEGEFGVWGRSGLLAAVGVAVRNWVTCHGAFLNVSPSMARFAYIDAVDPDRISSGRKSTLSCLLAERRLPVKMTSVRATIVQTLAEAFSCDRHHICTGHPLLNLRSEKSRESISRAS
jgi:lipoyl(octanoyl) transferase